MKQIVQLCCTDITQTPQQSDTNETFLGKPVYMQSTVEYNVTIAADDMRGYEFVAPTGYKIDRLWVDVTHTTFNDYSIAIDPDFTYSLSDNGSRTEVTVELRNDKSYNITGNVVVVVEYTLTPL